MDGDGGEAAAAAAAGAGSPADATRRRRRFRVAAAAIPVLALVVLELGLRLAGYSHPLDAPFYEFSGLRAGAGEAWLEGENSPMVRDPRVFWRMRPGWTSARGDERINPDGYRTPAVAVPKPPGVQRIVCLGDSVTFGIPWEMEDAWPAHLQQRLRDLRGDPRIEVVNMGVPGYSSHQAAVLLETDVPRLAPDVIVATFGHFNDWVPAIGRTDAEQRPPPWWRTLRVVELIAEVAGIGEPSSSSAAQPRHLPSLETTTFSGERRVPLAAFESNLRAFATGARELGARLVLVAAPLPALTVRNNPIARDYADATRRVGADLGVPVVDGWRAFAATGLRDAALFTDISHPTARGQEVLAEAVAAVIPPAR